VDSRPFVVKFEQLSLGNYEADFKADKNLLDNFGEENNVVIDVQVDIHLDLYKSSNMIDMNFQYKGSFDLLCDRCNEAMNAPVEHESKLVVKYGQTHHEDFDELVVLEEHEHDFNLAKYFYENLMLMIPARHVHDEKDCNPEVISQLKAMQSENDIKDPRWDKLKEL
jgi:uncharacterized protein